MVATTTIWFSTIFACNQHNKHIKNIQKKSNPEKSGSEKKPKSHKWLKKEKVQINALAKIAEKAETPHIMALKGEV